MTPPPAALDIPNPATPGTSPDPLIDRRLFLWNQQRYLLENIKLADTQGRLRHDHLRRRPLRQPLPRRSPLLSISPDSPVRSATSAPSSSSPASRPSSRPRSSAPGPSNPASAPAPNPLRSPGSMLPVTTASKASATPTPSSPSPPLPTSSASRSTGCPASASRSTTSSRPPSPWPCIGGLLVAAAIAIR